VNRPFQYPWDMPAAPAATPAATDTPPAKPKPRGRRPGSAAQSAGRASASGRERTAPDWLYHHLTISGPGAKVERFAAAARGAGVVPWRLDGAEVEDTVFNLAVSQPGRRTLSVDGCRILARQFRDRVEARQAQATALVGRSRACAFDLHTLLPVPEVILQLGPTHPTALSWLTAHWGVTDRLRQVVERPKPTAGRRLPKGHAVIGYGFFTAGETPQTAITWLGTQWPALAFSLAPCPAD
jgi:hypothetical protein